ncbi:unnamed protein product [Paramecium sonneborni]|uniref:Uncharacterized protein n=1 Tax=Paramecium sonneborni TaxID=65129 RepID=A0A8S1MFI9_9CILI|nr:unnamed protein product [Paramecium sonneborni]
MNHQLCYCKYRNPIEFVCTLKECTQRRLICQSCAWDHNHHNSKVLKINEFETMITNDALVQRIKDVYNSEGINTLFDQLVYIAQTDIMQILKKRCTELKDKVKKNYNPLNRTIEHIAKISKKQYDLSTIDFLVKELDISDIQGQLLKIEASQFQKFSLICKEILNLSEALDKLRKTCQEDSSKELKSIKNQIQSNLEYKEVKQKSLCDQDLNDFFEKPLVQLKKQSFYDHYQIQEQYNNNNNNNNNIYINNNKYNKYNRIIRNKLLKICINLMWIFQKNQNNQQIKHHHILMKGQRLSIFLLRL